MPRRKGDDIATFKWKAPKGRGNPPSRTISLNSDKKNGPSVNSQQDTGRVAPPASALFGSFPAPQNTESLPRALPTSFQNNSTDYPQPSQMQATTLQTIALCPLLEANRAKPPTNPPTDQTVLLQMYRLFPQFTCSAYSRLLTSDSLSHTDIPDVSLLAPEFMLQCGCVVSRTGLTHYESIVQQGSQSARQAGFEHGIAPCPFCGEVGDRADITVLGLCGFGNSFPERIQEIAQRRAEKHFEVRTQQLEQEVVRLQIANVRLREELSQVHKQRKRVSKSKYDLQNLNFEEDSTEEVEKLAPEAHETERRVTPVSSSQNQDQKTRKVSCGRFDLNFIDDEDDEENPSESPEAHLAEAQPTGCSTHSVEEHLPNAAPVPDTLKPVVSETPHTGLADTDTQVQIPESDLGQELFLDKENSRSSSKDEHVDHSNDDFLRVSNQSSPDASQSG